MLSQLFFLFGFYKNSGYKKIFKLCSGNESMDYKSTLKKIGEYAITSLPIWAFAGVVALSELTHRHVGAYHVRNFSDSYTIDGKDERERSARWTLDSRGRVIEKSLVSGHPRRPTMYTPLEITAQDQKLADDILAKLN